MINKRKDKNKNSVVKTIILILIAIFIVFVIARYTTDKNFRYYIDTNILKKEVSESTVTTIEIDSDSNPSVFAYDKYITVLNKNTLTSYTSSGKIDSELNVNISVPLVETNGKYMILAEKDGDKIYLISGSNIIWENSIDGSILRVNVNQNGYVSVVIKNTIYKSVVIFYNLSGTEILGHIVQKIMRYVHLFQQIINI